MRPCVAVILSLLFHAALAAALAAYVECAPAPDALAQLDLTRVELSFAEAEDETAAVSPSVASAPAEPVPAPPPPEPERPPEAEPSKERPPEPDAPSLPEPSPEPPPLETPNAAPPREERPPEEEPSKPAVAASAPAPAAAPRQARLDAKPGLRKDIRPDYPRGARLRGEHGDVTLEIEVAASGRAGDVAVVSSSGYAELDEAAVKAAKAARFTPARRGGRAVPSTARITITFDLK